MKKQKNVSKIGSKVSKKVILLLVAFLSIFAIVAALEHYNVINFGRDTTEAKGLAEGEKTNADKKKSLIENDTTSNSNQKTGTTNTDYSTPNDPDNIVLTAKQSDSNVTVTTKLIGYSDGTCFLDVSSGSKKYSLTASVIYQSEFSTCAGFSVPVSELGVGTWSIDLKIVSHEISQTKSISFEVK